MSIIPDTKTAMDPKDMKAMFAEWVINRMRLKHTDANRIAVNGQALPKAVHSTACGNAVLGAVFFQTSPHESTDSL